MPEPTRPTIFSDFLGGKGALKYGARVYKGAKLLNSKYNKMASKQILKLLGNVLKKKKKSFGKIKGKGMKGPETTKDFKKLKY